MEYFYLYRITNTVNGKIYVGVHKTRNLDDGYMGSGKVIQAAIAKHGLENFQKEILETFENAAQMFEREKEVVTDEFLARDDTYNLRRGGTGGFDYINSNNGFGSHSPDHSRMMVERRQEKLRTDPEFKKKHSEIQSRVSKKSHQSGKSYVFTDADRLKSKSPEKTAQTSKRMKETIAARGLHKGVRNSQFGSFWITDGKTSRKSKGEIPAGWVRGRTSQFIGL